MEFNKTSPAVLLAVMSAVSHMSNVLQKEVAVQTAKTTPDAVRFASQSFARLPESTLQSVVKSLPKEMKVDEEKVKTLLALNLEDSTDIYGAAINACYTNCYTNCHSNRSWR